MMKKNQLHKLIKEIISEQNQNNNIDNLITYLKECIKDAEKLKKKDANENQDFGSLISSIIDGLRENFEY